MSRVRLARQSDFCPPRPRRPGVVIERRLPGWIARASIAGIFPAPFRGKTDSDKT